MAGTIQPYRPVQPDEGPDILLPVVGGLQELIYGTPGLFIDRPGFIADAQPDTAIGGAVQALTRLNCRIWASRDKGNYRPSINQQNADLCGPYLDSLGERPTDGEFGSPIEGGQCPVLYDVSISYTIVLGFCENVQTFNEPFANAVLGPLQVFTDNVGTPGGTQNLCPGFSYSAIRLVHANGSTVRGSGFGVTLNNISVVRVDGLPDNCGNPPPLIQPPATVTPVTPISPSVEINLPGSGPITINVDIDEDGDLVIEAPDLGVEVTIEPEVDPGGGGGGGDPGDPTDPGSPGSPEGTGGGGDAEGEAPPGEELVGLLVTVTEAPEDANRFANNSRQPFRGIGYVRMGYPDRLGLDISGSTVISPQFFHAPQRGLTNWAVAANIGFNLTIVPYYRSIEP